MPGIAGLITRLPREQAEAALLQMVRAMHHEPAWDTGTWGDEPLGVYVGWAGRRSTFSHRVPLCNQRKEAALVFCGEEFSEPEFGTRLAGSGNRNSAERSAYFIDLYEEDPSFPAPLNGWFHGLLADRRRGKLVLFNDRYGLRRIYYHQSKEAFYFAAEAKAILEVCPELRSADPRGLGEFVACGCVLENRTVFAGINVLPPASAWIFREGALVGEKSYFEPREWEQQPPLTPEAYYENVRETFSRNLPRYFGGGERIGMSLTGGLDTRMIMAWHKPSPGSLPCYSFGGMFRDCQDVLLARQVAQACQQPHEVIALGQQFLSRFSHYAEQTVYLTDGCAGVNHAPDLYVNERAAEIAPVRMTGNYGGEVLRGVVAFKAVEPAGGLFKPELLSHVHRACETYNQIRMGHPLSFAVFRQAPWFHYGLLALEQSQLTLRSPYLDNDFVKVVYRAPRPARVEHDLCLRLIAEGDATLCRIRTDRGVGGKMSLLPAALSRKVLEFTAKAEYAYDSGMPHWLARIDKILSPFHPGRLFLGRHKFYHFRTWYKSDLGDYVQDILLDPRSRSRPYIERQAIELMIRDHIRGTRNYTVAIHKLLTIELLHRLFLDPK